MLKRIINKIKEFLCWFRNQNPENNDLYKHAKRELSILLDFNTSIGEARRMDKCAYSKYYSKVHKDILKLIKIYIKICNKDYRAYDKITTLFHFYPLSPIYHNEFEEMYSYSTENSEILTKVYMHKRYHGLSKTLRIDITTGEILDEKIQDVNDVNKSIVFPYYPKIQDANDANKSIVFPYRPK